jgi:hypothetical protein
MAFTLIKGTFHATRYSPDGDTVRFKAHDESYWDSLSGPPIKLNASHHASLRFEAVDALETHFERWHQPLQFARDARDYLLNQLGITNVQWNPSERTVISADDGTEGYILSRAVEKNRRAVAFVFGGDAPEPDGASIFLDAARVRQSVNYQLLEAGLTYPTYYEGLFYDLRDAFTQATLSARTAGRGLWSQDRTTQGFDVQGIDSITDVHVILPKLFRRMADYLEGGGPIAGFVEFLADDPDPLLVISASHFTNLDTIVRVDGDIVSMTEPPENLVFNPNMSS